jgi:hypothetical protein
MMRRNRRWVAGLIVGTLLIGATPASAGPYVNVMQPCDCPPTHYSALHVLTPAFYRWGAWCQGPSRYTFACIQHPDLQPGYYIKPYHCPSANPLQFAVNNYPGLGSPPPGSTYKSPPPPQKKTSPKESSPGGPQLLPPPREEPSGKK